MALLELQGIGKIYVSDVNVSVGIRGASISFERGEFVAVTGKSGSGKSTLLNVISGIDTYEEGELLIEGEPTSHYLQPDWEAYRQKYISFIFQGYNIIESYTVLENVELALMHIEDRRERRERALELLGRVGLSDRIHQKGSRLSGGQKQRTVIARALAKDSPIILADEPTGNLDSESAAEIVELLREVSRDRLLIVVTHNFDEVAEHATRHIRIHDGAIVSDRTIKQPEPINGTPNVCEAKPSRRREDIKNGITLGRSIFLSRPKLSVFICLLLLVGTLGLFFVTSICGDARYIFEDTKMFRHIEGRVVMTGKDGGVISDGELSALAEKYVAVSVLHYDLLLDTVYEMTMPHEDGSEYLTVECELDSARDEKLIGRRPEAENEVLLSLPIYCKSYFDESLADAQVLIGGLCFDVVGVSYYYDNNRTATARLSPDGFRAMNAYYFIFNHNYKQISGELYYSAIGAEGVYADSLSILSFGASFGMEEGKVYIRDREFMTAYKDLASRTDVKLAAALDLSLLYNDVDQSKVQPFVEQSFVHSIFGENFTDVEPSSPVFSTPSQDGGFYGDDYYYYATSFSPYYDVVFSVSILTDIAEELLSRSYSQASLFFEDDARAAEVAEALRAEGYVAVTSDTEYTPDPFETIVSTIAVFMLAAFWLVTVLFLGFFINLCSSRAIDAFRSDMAIMRSMGIPVRVIRIGMYVRMIFSLVPVYLTVICAAAVIFLVPATNAIFNYLYLWQYALIFFGMLIVIYRVTRRHVRRLFGESVKHSLKGGSAV